jgi:hypothetical protein
MDCFVVEWEINLPHINFKSIKNRLKRDQTELIAIMILKSIFFIDLFQMASPFLPFETLVFLLVVILCNFLPYFLFIKLFRLCKGKSAKDHLSPLYSG